MGESIPAAWDQWHFASFRNTIIAMGPDGFWKLHEEYPGSEGVARAVARLNAPYEPRLGFNEYQP